MTSFLLVACGSGQDREKEPRIETLPDGSTRIVYGALDVRPLETIPIAEWELWEPDGSYVFNRISSITAGKRNFLLLDAGNRQIVELRPDGGFVRSFGQEGSGPGELRYPIHIDLEGERIWVSDVGNRRFAIFDRAGALLEDRKWPGAARIVNRFSVISAGEVLQGGSWPLTVAELAEQDPIYYLARFDLGDTPAAAPGQGVADTLLVLPAPRYLAVPMTSADGREQNPFFGNPPFAAEMYWASDGGTVVTITGNDYRFEIRDATGRVQRQAEAAAPDLTVTETHKRWYWEREFPLRFVDRESYEPTPGAKARIPFAERRQALGGIALDRERRIWVEANLTEPGRSRLDIFSDEGIYLGSIEDGSVPAAITGDGAVLIREPAPDGLDRFRTFHISFQ